MKKQTLALLLSCALAAGMIGGCGSKTEATTEENVQTAQTEAVAETGTEAVSDQDAADHVAALIDAIYVQERTDETDAQCAEAVSYTHLISCIVPRLRTAARPAHPPAPLADTVPVLPPAESLLHILRRRTW